MNTRPTYDAMIVDIFKRKYKASSGHQHLVGLARRPEDLDMIEVL